MAPSSMVCGDILLMQDVHLVKATSPRRNTERSIKSCYSLKAISSKLCFYFPELQQTLISLLDVFRGDECF